MPKIRGVKPDYWTDEDIVELSIPARLLFIGLWNYACDNGHLQDKSKQIKMRILPADDVNVAELLRELEAKGSLERSEGWISIPTLTKHQKPDKRYWQTCERPGCTRPDRDSQPETRGGHHEATPGARSGLAVVSRGPLGDGDGDGDGELKVMVKTSAAPAPHEPTIRDDVDRICNHLADRISEDGSKRPTIGKTWHDAARLMLDKDGRTEAEIHQAIDWCQSHHFWRTNVLSMPTLREKFDRLRKVALAEQQQRPNKRQQETDDIFSKAARRMGVTE